MEKIVKIAPYGEVHYLIFVLSIKRKTLSSFLVEHVGITNSLRVSYAQLSADSSKSIFRTLARGWIGWKNPHLPIR